mgnify:CR=1 FL=1
MTEVAIFSRRETQALGRNGLMKAKGISLFVSEPDQTFTIEPINSKGVTGRCSIHIPLEDLDQVIKKLTRIQPVAAA